MKENYCKAQCGDTAEVNLEFCAQCANAIIKNAQDFNLVLIEHLIEVRKLINKENNAAGRP